MPISDSITITALFILSILSLLYIFGKWKIREIMIRKVAKDLNLNFKKKEGIIEIEGKINNNSILISESTVFVRQKYKAFSNPYNLKVPRKKIEIKINEKNIYERICTSIFPLPNKIKKIINGKLKKI